MIAPPPTPTFFYDYFTGSGALSGHTPDTPWGGYAWTSSTLSIVTNAAVSADQADTGRYGSASYGARNTSYGGPVRSTTAATFTTGSAIGANAYGHKGMAVDVNSGGSDFRAEVYGTPSGTWFISVTDLKSGISNTTVLTIAADTSYDFSFLVDDGQQVASLKLGEDAVGDVSLSVDYDTAWGVLGVSAITLTVGATCFVDELHITGDTNGIFSVLAAPSPVLAGHGNTQWVDVTAPSPTLAAFGGASMALSVPRPVLSATGSLSSYGVQAIAPSPTLSAFGGASAALTAPTFSLDITGTVTNWGTSAVSPPAATITASGTVSASASSALSAPMPDLVGYSGAVVGITLTGSPTLQATGTTGGIGGAQVTCPLFELTASGTAQNYGSTNLLAPSPKLGGQAQAWLIAPGATLTAIGAAVVTATYEAYAVNLNHRDPASNNQVTRYTNYPFDRIVRYKNSYFGMNSTGLYLLEGTTDNATPIAYDVKTHVTDFDATEQKTVVSAYMGGRMGAAETVTLFAGEKTANAYPYTTPRGATPQNYRQKFGRGIKARYYGIGFKGDKEFDLDTLELEINKLPRRI